MYNHAAKEYVCPICVALKGVENAQTKIKQADLIYQDRYVTALVSSYLVADCPGHVIIVPNTHFENIYDLPNVYASHIHKTAKRIALAMKLAYKCDGISTWQNNEPAGDQHALHFHFHVFPRYRGDNFKQKLLKKEILPPAQRRKYAQKLRRYL